MLHVCCNTVAYVLLTVIWSYNSRTDRRQRPHRHRSFLFFFFLPTLSPSAAPPASSPGARGRGRFFFSASGPPTACTSPLGGGAEAPSPLRPPALHVRKRPSSDGEARTQPKPPCARSIRPTGTCSCATIQSTPPVRSRSRAPRMSASTTSKQSGWPRCTGGLETIQSYRGGARPGARGRAAGQAGLRVVRRARGTLRRAAWMAKASESNMCSRSRSAGCRASRAAPMTPEPQHASSSRARGRGGVGSARSSAAVITSSPPPANRPGYTLHGSPAGGDPSTTSLESVRHPAKSDRSPAAAWAPRRERTAW
eukprot:scaffold394_cov112-Isochrysis_galbana.AAC.7